MGFRPDSLTMKYLVALVLFASVAFAFEQETDLQKAYEEDKAFFFRFIDELLFDDDSSFQRRMFRNQGLLGMAMPDDLRDEGSFTGGLYANLKQMAYDNARRYGLTNSLHTVSDMFGIAK